MIIDIRKELISMTKFQYTVKEEDKGLPIKQLLRTNFAFSARLRTKIKQNQGVMLNGVPTEGWITPKPGDVITINLPEEGSFFEPEPIPLAVVYEDKTLLILNKQPGLVVHPTKGQISGTLANGIMQYLLDTDQSFKIRFVNRLDRDTSGLLMVGKNSYVQNEMVKQIKAGTIEKIYLAIVKGFVKDEEGVIDLPIGLLDPERPERGVKEDGAPSLTKYRVLERYGCKYTLLRLKLETGRTHQIRVHLSHIGYPIVGDSLYGTGESDGINRQALHAFSLDFKHPATGNPMHVEAPMPADMEAFIESKRI